ncbi:hypothetical protein [Pantoea stewartii]|uniref:hypothetical protein n=1 Tax=Pantoea stewartii TaxID=66269 RepID=UPI0007365E7C|nr:hypothetical protein [Pantoea stewartii]KTS25339.1 hypothetical protein NS381_21325 [Pantoea stewartii]
MKRLIYFFLLMTSNALAAQTPDLKTVQEYCHITSIPLIQAASDAVIFDAFGHPEKMKALSDTVFSSQIFKAAPDDVRKAMKDTLEEVILSKDKKDKLLKAYSGDSQHDRNVLSSVWAYYSVEPYLIRCAYMKFAG